MKIPVAMAALAASLVAGCINWDDSDGASDIFCRHRPSVCDPDSVKRFDAGTTVSQDAGFVPGGGGGGGGGGGSGGSNYGGTLDTFDPSEVYLLGTLETGIAGWDAVSTLSNPDEPTIALHVDSDDSPIVRPTDGKLIYSRYSDEVTLAFTSEKFTWDEAAGRYRYPEDYEANDAQVVGTVCTHGTMPIGPLWFTIAPDTGGVFYSCGDGLRHPDGTPLALQLAGFRALGHAGYILGTKSTREHAIQAPDGTVTEVTGGLPSDLFVVRSHSAGFQAAVEHYDSTTNTATYEHWVIDAATAVATKTATYGAGEKIDKAKLAGNGDLYGFGSTGLYVVKYPIGGGAPEVVYSRVDAPATKWTDPPSHFVYGNRLFTGP